MNDHRLQLGDDGELHEQKLEPKPKRHGDDGSSSKKSPLIFGAIAVFLAGLVIGFVLACWMIAPTVSTAILKATELPSHTPPPSLSVSALPPIYKTINVNEYATYTVYWSRALWRNAVGGSVTTEDFEKDTADYGVIKLAYLTGNNILLEGHSSAQILKDQTLLPGGTMLHFRDWQDGLTFSFPDSTAVRAFGFDFRSSEAWQLKLNDSTVPLAAGRGGFVGVVFSKTYPREFVLAGPEGAQGGLTVDNISYLPTSAECTIPISGLFTRQLDG